MAAITICSDSGVQKNKVWHCFHCSPIYFPCSDRTRCKNLKQNKTMFLPNSKLNYVHNHFRPSKVPWKHIKLEVEKKNGLFGTFQLAKGKNLCMWISSNFTHSLLLKTFILHLHTCMLKCIFNSQAVKITFLGVI